MSNEDRFRQALETIATQDCLCGNEGDCIVCVATHALMPEQVEVGDNNVVSIMLDGSEGEAPMVIKLQRLDGGFPLATSDADKAPLEICMRVIGALGYAHQNSLTLEESLSTFGLSLNVHKG